MNVVDSSAWMAWFAASGNARNFGPAILDAENLLVPSVTLTEVFKSMFRQRGEAAAVRAVTQMEQGMVIPLDGSLALEAALCGLDRRLPLADSIIYATARRFGATLWTQDADFEGLPGVEYFAAGDQGE
jgi:predicted nucleic acid-binding protein